MLRTVRILKQVVLLPGSYRIRELVFGLDFIVVVDGPLTGETFPIWDTNDNTITYIEDVPLTLTYTATRGWRTLWRQVVEITVSDGENTVSVTQQLPEEVPVVIERQ